MREHSIQQFDSEQFGNLRVVCDENGEPWFIVNDICSYFGITNKNRVMQHVDAEDKGGTQIATPGGMQTVATVNEGGLYSILFYIQPTKARGLTKEEVDEKYKKVRKFKRWVTHEVLPSIRKHGAYITPQTMADMMADPRNIAKVFSALADEQEKVQALTDDNARMLPKAVAYDATMDADGTYTVTQVSRYLNQMGTPMTVKRLYALLRADEMICKSGNAPTKKAIRQGLARQMMTVRTDGKANDPYARLTQKGLDWCVTHYATMPTQMKAI